MIQFLRDLDHVLFHFINETAAAPWLDPLMITLSSKWIWIPFYGLLVVMLVARYKKRVWLVLLMLAIVGALSDSISSRLLKPMVQRTRPNKAPDLEVRMPNPKDGNSQYGFVSSHAANSFAIFVFAGLFLWDGWRRFLLFLIIPVFVSYSRVYLGVHYPADVMAGGILGITLAWAACYLYMRFAPPEPDSDNSVS